MKFFYFKILSFGFLIIFSLKTYAQENSPVSEIIKKIYDLEKNRDPKCYASANRLEDFMYGTPLNEDARNFKIDIQKEIIFYLQKEASSLATKDKASKIQEKHLLPIINKVAQFSKDKKGDYLYKVGNETIRVSNKDFSQYSSVSYGYRSLLSVEQDMMYFPKNDLLSFNADALQKANEFVNLITLVTLNIADKNARKANKNEITKQLLKDSWLQVLETSSQKKQLSKTSYPVLSKNSTEKKTSHNEVVKEIIQQKVASYEKYNQLNASVFLRNIQVYFARQKWPVEEEASNTLKNYYLESLVQFSNALLKETNKIAQANNSLLIRMDHVQKALNYFLPISTNTFEDITYFPNNPDGKATIESYDLDAFRDSGFHWHILGYSLEDLKDETLKDMDPNAAELVVENIAQMGVLVLRLAGQYSHENNKGVLDLDDINSGFSQIQQLINSYGNYAPTNNETKINSAQTTSNRTSGFEDATLKSQLQFEHKSSDWLNRLIRSYTTSDSENAIKLAIPPAFGGSGVACEDINNDGFVDVLLLSGFGNKLFLNSKEGRFTDISEISNINNTWSDSQHSFGEPRQPIIADFNNDGKEDIFITYVNDAHKMYKNIDGSHFEDVSLNTQLGGKNAVGGPATTFDYNNDGLLDIFIGYFGNYIEGTLPTLSRDNVNGMPNKLYKNMGNFVFQEVEFTKDINSNRGWTQALGHSDINQDGWQDIIVGNDFGNNKYYLNNKDGMFTEISKQLGTDKPSYTMNVGITDLNGDMYPDFYISNIVVMQKDEKYVSPNADTEMKFDPKKMATIRTVEANDLFLSHPENNTLKQYDLSTNIGRGYSATGWSWDADFFDFDNDGDEDLYCLNGMNDFSVYSSENPFYFERQEKSKSIVYAESNREKNVFFVNENGELLNEAEKLGADLNSNARSASYLDFDNDGDLDILINNYHEKATLLENKTSSGNNWIKIKLIGDPSKNINKDAIGSVLILNTKNHKNMWREIHSTTGYLSVHPKEQHFGLGEDTQVDLLIKWSNGDNYTVKNITTNKRYQITYPDTVEVIK